MNEDRQTGGIVFVDTNILIYAYDLDAGEKRNACKEVLRELWKTGNGVISTQVMQEFYVNVTHKIPQPLSLAKAREIIRQYDAWPVETIRPATIIYASEIQQRYQLSFWDALIVATADQAGAGTLLSEDLNAGQKIEEIEILNPISRY